MSLKRATAHELIDKGLHVLFCRPNSKVPATPHGLKDATDDHVVVDRMFAQRADWNLGVHAGRSGLVVFDLDKKHGINGWDALDAAMVEFGELPGCPMVNTPSAGAHLYFRDPTGGELKPSAGKLGPGLDVRAGESYVVAPPSTIGGTAYTWSLREQPIVELPATWVEALRPPKRVEPVERPQRVCDPEAAYRYGAKVLNDEADKAAAAKLNRNCTLTECAFRVGRIADQCRIAPDDAAKLFEWAVAQWSDAGEVDKGRRTFWRAFEAGRESPRGDLNL